MNNAKHTIECCDSWCKTEGITTYSELLAALTLAHHALKAADKIIFAAGGNGGISVQLAQARDKARAAIAKATKGE